MTNTTGDQTQTNLIVFAQREADIEQAEQLAKRLKIAITVNPLEAEQTDLMLRLDENGLSLVSGELVLRGDFTRMLPRLRPGNLQRELLVKAAKIKHSDAMPTAIDATAGLGEDALLLAAVGFSVHLYEYDAVIAALLRDAMWRAAQMPELAEIIGRMQLFETDSLTELRKLSVAPDVILLDPMFPERQKSALIKKKFQLLQKLERPCADEIALVNAAIAAHPHKIVIKRPLKGPYLADRKPSYSIKGKAIRYDCLVLP